MAEFYVTYARDDGRYLALVIAPERPTALQFVSRGDFHAAMDALGHAWQLQYEIPGYGSAEWLERMAQAGAETGAATSRQHLFDGNDSVCRGLAAIGATTSQLLKTLLIAEFLGTLISLIVRCIAVCKNSCLCSRCCA